MDSVTDLAEQLRDHADAWDSGHTMSAASDDLREAATTLEILTQENARLREALGQYSLAALIGMINAAGGKITVRPRDVENVINQEVVAYYDPTNDTKVYRVRARKALGGGDEG